MENEQVEQKMNKKPSKYSGLTSAKGSVGLGSLCDLLAAELMIGFWFGIGAILAIKMLSSLEELISRK